MSSQSGAQKHCFWHPLWDISVASLRNVRSTRLSYGAVMELNVSLFLNVAVISFSPPSPATYAAFPETKIPREWHSWPSSSSKSYSPRKSRNVF